MSESKRIGVCLLAAVVARDVLALISATNRTVARIAWSGILEDMEQLRKAIDAAWPKEGEK